MSLTKGTVYIGDTLNEIYEKIGEPDCLVYGAAHYNSTKDDSIISIEDSDRIYDSRTNRYLDVKNNIVTEVHLEKKGEKDGK